MSDIDKHHRLDSEPFTYTISKDNKVFICWQGKKVTILKENESSKFLEQILKASSPMEQQLILAKVTGNFKRGNEKSYKNK